MLQVLNSLFSATSAWTQSLVEIDLRRTHPTQPALGFRVVDRKVRKLRMLGGKTELQRYLFERAAPAVLGPGHSIFVLDRHHDLAALLRMGQTKAYVRIKASLAHLTWIEFQSVMIEKGWVYLLRHGGPVAFADLPQTLDSMIDDPYRSLASELRQENGYLKTSNPFAEFVWAEALREQIPPALAEDDPLRALELARGFAGSSRASHLPGFREGAKYPVGRLGF